MPIRFRLSALNNWTSVFLTAVERGGNALPHPGTLFAILAGVIIVVSGIAARTGLEAIHPGTGETIQPISLLTVAGLHRILVEMVTNFTSFAPLGTVLVSMLGIGVMEASGLIAAVLRLLVLSAPKRLLTFVIVLSGVLSNTASEIGYVLLVPLGRHHLPRRRKAPHSRAWPRRSRASRAATARICCSARSIRCWPACRRRRPRSSSRGTSSTRPPTTSSWWCRHSSISAAGTWVTERIVIPRLGDYKGEEQSTAIDELSDQERRGLRFAAVAMAVFGAILLWGTVPVDGFLRNPETGSLLRSPFLSGIVAFIFLGGTWVGIAYGVGAGRFKNDTDVMNGMGKTISTLGTYLVLVFFAAQFVAYFNWTNLGLIMAVKGAETLRASGLGGVPLMLSFVLLSSCSTS